MSALLTVQNTTAVQLPPGVRQLGVQLLARASRLARRRFVAVNAVFVTPATMRQLNRTYRHHDQVTDVLSFTYEQHPVSGELIICLEQAARQARRQRHSLQHELAVLLTHGFLHLAGYDHVKLSERRVMRALEQQVLRATHSRP